MDDSPWGRGAALQGVMRILTRGHWVECVARGSGNSGIEIGMALLPFTSRDPPRGLLLLVNVILGSVGL